MAERERQWSQALAREAQIMGVSFSTAVHGRLSDPASLKCLLNANAKRTASCRAVVKSMGSRNQAIIVSFLALLLLNGWISI